MLWSEKSAEYIYLPSNKIKALKWARPTYCLAGTEFTQVFFRLIHTERVLRSASLSEVNVGRNTEVLFPASTEQSGGLHPISPSCINDSSSLLLL